MSTNRLDSFVPEIQRLRSLHQSIDAQLKHVEYLQSIANQELQANTQTIQPPQREGFPPKLHEIYAATLHGIPAMGMKWATHLE